MNRKLKLGFIGFGNLAQRSIIEPLIKDNTNFKIVTIATKSQLNVVKHNYPQVKYTENYNDVVNDPEIDAIYINLPPSLHEEWIIASLTADKHVYCEKPLTLSYLSSEKCRNLARARKLILVEGYMYFFSKQFETFESLISDYVGEILDINASFTIPLFDKNNFRFDKKIGGGAIFDTCGYPLSLILKLLGPDVGLITANKILNLGSSATVGSAYLSSKRGATASLTYGIEAGYTCFVKVIGSKGSIYTDRIFTARSGHRCTFIVNHGGKFKEFNITNDDHFQNAFRSFKNICTAGEGEFYGQDPKIIQLIEEIKNA